ncbi:MAG TPA: alpha/beta hydrolase [Haliangiales bacterium]|nr:alpha/beta hydrolase [Haliangiales bacterium]
MVPGLVHKRFASFDGTEIAYQVRGEGPPVVLANGLGGTYEAFRYVYHALGEAYRIVCWDYRGLYGSARPRDLATLAVASQSRDLALLLDREKVDRAVLIGWSMGVQVNFELCRHHRDRAAGIVAINGTYGSPFRTALASRLARYLIPPWLSFMKAQAPLISRVSQATVAWSGLVPAMARLGLVSTRIDEEAMRDVAEGFKGMDFAIYSDTLRALGEHDARDILPRLDVPTLVIAGDRDLMTPTFTARRMSRWIRGARLVVIPGGTHYTPLEFPQVIEAEVLAFLGGIPGWEPRCPQVKHTGT